jgi:hypothetical protein
MRKSEEVFSPVQSGREVTNSPHKVHIYLEYIVCPLDGISVANSFPPRMAKNLAAE